MPAEAYIQNPETGEEIFTVAEPEREGAWLAAERPVEVEQ